MTTILWIVIGILVIIIILLILGLMGIANSFGEILKSISKR